MAGRLEPVAVGQALKLLHGHGLLLDVDLLVDALLARHHLADGRRDGHVQLAELIARLAWFELLGGNDLQRDAHTPIRTCLN